MGDKVNKSNLLNLNDTLPTSPFLFSWLATSTFSAYRWVVAILVHVFVSRLAIVGANIPPGTLFGIIAKRPHPADVSAHWSSALVQAGVGGTGVLDTEAKVIALIAALGRDGRSGEFCKALDAAAAAPLLFPSATTRLPAIAALCSDYIALKHVKPISLTLAAFWGVSEADLAPLFYEALTAVPFAKLIAYETGLEAELIMRQFISPLKKEHAHLSSGAVSAAQATAWLQALETTAQEISQAVYERQQLAQAAPAVVVAAAAPSKSALEALTATVLDLKAELKATAAAVQAAQPLAKQGGRRSGGGGIRGGRRRGERGGGGRGDGGSNGTPFQAARDQCRKCRGFGHYARECPSSSSVKDNDNDDYYVGALAQLQQLRWGAPLRLDTRAEVQAHGGTQATRVDATFDTGCPYSIISPEAARRLGCIVTPYTGPELVSVTGQLLEPVGETFLERIELRGWRGSFRRVIVGDSPWPLLVGLKDIFAAGTLLADLLDERRQRRPAVVGGFRTAVEGVAELRAASEVAQRLAGELLQREEAGRAGAVPVPASLGHEMSSRAEPAIDFHSVAETRRRLAYKSRFCKAKNEVVCCADFPERALFEAAREEFADVFSVKDIDVKPPVMDVSQPGAYPLQLHLLAGQQAQTVAQPPFESRREADRLAHERDVLLRCGKAVPAVRALAIGTAFVVNKNRVVYAATDANRILYGTAHTLPSIDRQVRELAAFDGLYSLSFDMTEGFLQWAYARGSGAAACIRIAGTTLEPLTPSMGVSCVPAEFHHMISRIFEIKPADSTKEPLLADCIVRSLIDDFGGKARSAKALVALFRFLCARARQYGIHWNAPKCLFGHKSLIYCGNEIIGRDIHTLIDYTETMLAMGRPVEREEMMSLLGMCGWIMPHLSDVFTDLAELRDVLSKAGASKTARLPWTPAAAAAFERVRKALSNPKVLTAYDPSKTLFALTDASTRSGACCFMQLHFIEGQWVLRLVYAVCTNFTKAERNYGTPEQELAALRDAHKRMPWLTLGRTVVWLTDNAAVALLLQGAKITKVRRLRSTWADLTGVRIVACHIDGKINVLADALSRNPALKHLPPIDEDATLELRFLPLEPTHAVGAVFSPANAPQSQKMQRALAAVARATRVSPDMAALTATLLENDSTLAPFRAAACSGAVIDGLSFVTARVGELELLFARNARDAVGSHRLSLVVPAGLRQPVLETLHAASGHAGLRRFTALVGNSFWWPAFARDARALVAACDACARARRVSLAGNFGNADADPLLNPDRPGQVYEMDTWSWPSASGGELIVTGSYDKFDGFVTLQRQLDHTSAGTARHARQLHDVFGWFAQMHTDGGPEFKGEFAAFLERLRTTHSRGSAGNSNSQAGIERVFGVLTALLTRLIAHNPGAKLAPDDVVSALVTGINSIVSPAVAGAPASSAFSRKFGRPAPFSPLLACTALPDATPESSLSVDAAQFVLALANGAAALDVGPLTDEQRAARRAAQVTRTQQAVARTHGPPLIVTPGDLVFLNSAQPPIGKISRIIRGRIGPFRVLSVTPPMPNGAPLKAVLTPLYVDKPFSVFVRELIKCGPALAIDDQMLRSLPPSGFFVGELVGDESEAAIAKLQAITEQSLAPEVRARLQAQRRAASRSRASQEQQEVQVVEVVRPPIPDFPVQELFDDDDDDDDDVDSNSDGEAVEGGEESDPENEPELAVQVRPQRVRQRPQRFRDI